MKTFKDILALLGIDVDAFFEGFCKDYYIRDLNKKFPVEGKVIKLTRDWEKDKVSYYKLLGWNTCHDPYTYLGSTMELDYIPCDLVDGKLVEHENPDGFVYAFYSNDTYIDDEIELYEEEREAEQEEVRNP